mmetsp:Transcript_6983/g.21259  ORF Transcript_6983/g.21259 Transcript_6983/m.21259 type:complete len:226 (+) Transcript_6983:619-1296(+)
MGIVKQSRHRNRIEVKQSTQILVGEGSTGPCGDVQEIHQFAHRWNWIGVNTLVIQEQSRQPGSGYDAVEIILTLDLLETGYECVQVECGLSNATLLKKECCTDGHIARVTNNRDNVSTRGSDLGCVFTGHDEVNHVLWSELYGHSLFTPSSSHCKTSSSSRTLHAQKTFHQHLRELCSGLHGTLEAKNLLGSECVLREADYQNEARQRHRNEPKNESATREHRNM